MEDGLVSYEYANNTVFTFVFLGIDAQSFRPTHDIAIYNRLHHKFQSSLHLNRSSTILRSTLFDS